MIPFQLKTQAKEKRLKNNFYLNDSPNPQLQAHLVLACL